MKKRIIIVGYPKSGTVWVTRLISGLLDAPIVGFWKEPNNANLIEHLERKSKFEVYHSHHSYDELKKDINHDFDKIIYVVRDPRDIVISAGHFFPLNRFNKLKKIFSYFTGGNKLYRTIFEKSNYRNKKFIEAILYGNKFIHPWLSISWAQHILPYINNNIFLIQYENLYKNTFQEMKKINNYLGADKKDHCQRRSSG